MNNQIDTKLYKNSFVFCMLVQLFYFIPAIINIADNGNIESYILNMFDAQAFHWLIITSYLYWIYKYDTVLFHTLYRIRFHSKVSFYIHIIVRIIKHTLFFIIPFSVIAIMMLFISNNLFFFSVLAIGLINLSLGIIIIGVAIAVFNCLIRNRIWSYTLIFLLLTIDFLCSVGVLRFDLNVLYYQMLSIQFYLSAQVEVAGFLLISAILLIKILIIFSGGYLLLKYRSTRNKAIFWLSDMQYIKRVLFALPIGLLLGAFYGNSVSSLSEYLLLVFGGIGSIEYDPISIIIFSLPFYLYLYLFIDIVNFFKNTTYVYIFTRGLSQLKFLLSKSITVFCCSICYYLLLFFSSLIIPLLLDVPLGPKDLFFESLIALLFICVAGSTMILYIVNLIFLKTKKTLVFFFTFSIVMLGQLLYLMIPSPFSNYVIQALPTTQFQIILHDIPLLRNQWPDFFPRYVSGFSIWYTHIYSWAAIIISFIFYNFRIKKMDLF